MASPFVSAAGGLALVPVPADGWDPQAESSNKEAERTSAKDVLNFFMNIPLFINEIALTAIIKSKDHANSSFVNSRIID
ncbi:hypothetical protein [Mycobacteroides abscessus]|uniref:hypothetical protein n=1 Tax=Mycobacteroides abscessus TaxID=36809 RepID=UPI0018E3FB83